MDNIPIPTLHLFPLLEAKLTELLRSLSVTEWNMATIARQWTVKDVAAHLLDGNVRAISLIRDEYAGPPPENTGDFKDLVSYLNNNNATWVSAMKRMSPALLIELLEITGRQYTEQMVSLDPFAPATFAVAWAGDKISANWFHVAREYTERWHHQQQIRDAVAKTGIMTREFYYPVLATFMQALPFAYRHTVAANGTVVQVTITGDAGGTWFITKKEKWEAIERAPQPPAVHTSINGAVAWKLFTKSWRKTDMLEFVTITGDENLALPVLDMITVMA